MSDLVKRLRRYSCSEHGTDFALGSGCISCESAAETHEAADRIESLEADHEKAVALVIEASIATGHADTSADLMAEVLHKVGELRAENAALREALNQVRTDAAEDIESWAGYASEYFQEKHDLKGCLAKYRPPTTDKGE